jgi:DNA repair protein RecN (Recombination protein N)
MLSQLEIHDFAIVRSARVDFGPGLCVLSGETGAGKSLVIDAIEALVGGRAGADAVRSGAEAARLRAVFELADSPAAAQRLVELGCEPDPDGLLALTREIRRDGRTGETRSRCTVNGSLANVSLLKALGETLIDLHGQHEHQSLLKVAEHLRLLDAAAGAALAAPRTAWAALWTEWRAVATAMQRLKMDEAAKEQRLDRLRHQIREIEEARPAPDEEDDLRADRARLAHAEQLLAWAAAAVAALAEGEESPAAIDRVAAARSALETMAAVDADLAAPAAELAAALATLEETARLVSRYADGIEADPKRLDAIEERLELLGRLRRKYGATLAEVLASADAARAELTELEAAEDRLADLAARQTELRPRLEAAAAALTADRAAAAQRLTAAVEGHLGDLNLDGVHFEVAVRPRPEWGEEGADAVEFLFSANPGEPPRPLARIASGGEISRVMLALKSQLAAADAVPTMIFDEIDVGIGGLTIRSVARKMAALGRERQIIVVTHHAPIAAYADVHVAIDKSAAAHGAQLTITRLTAEARVQELARMLGRRPPTAATLSMARELLDEVSAQR